MPNVGDPVKLKADGRVGSIVGTDPLRVALPIDIPNPRYEGRRTIAGIEEVEVSLNELEVDFIERHEHTRPNGTVFYTDQHGEVCLNT